MGEGANLTRTDSGHSPRSSSASHPARRTNRGEPEGAARGAKVVSRVEEVGGPREPSRRLAQLGEPRPLVGEPLIPLRETLMMITKIDDATAVSAAALGASVSSALCKDLPLSPPRRPPNPREKKNPRRWITVDKASGQTCFLHGCESRHIVLWRRKVRRPNTHRASPKAAWS